MSRINIIISEEGIDSAQILFGSSSRCLQFYNLMLAIRIGACNYIYCPQIEVRWFDGRPLNRCRSFAGEAELAFDGR
jgi:hypothetical protein